MSAANPPSAPEPLPAQPASGAEVPPVSDVAPAAAAGSGFGTAAAAEAAAPQASAESVDQRPRKGPLSFLSGALTSGLLAWLSLGLSQKVVGYYAEHPPHYSAQIAQSIATALKTLIVGMCFLATFSFAFIGVGLALTFLRSLLQPRHSQGAS
ncbi:DUF3082 domain-containing protein [Synechococcus sp. CBW1004]|nr:DUF3082 domain-containing protein [Synechococcus sp. CBW1004]